MLEAPASELELLLVQRLRMYDFRMAKTRLIRKNIRPGDASYVVEFSPPLRVSSLLRFPGIKVYKDVDPKDTPMRYAVLSVGPDAATLFGSDEGGSNDETPWYDLASAVSRDPMTANEFLQLIGRGSIAGGDVLPEPEPEQENLGYEDQAPRHHVGPLAQGDIPVLAIGVAVAGAVGFIVGRATSRAE